VLREDAPFEYLMTYKFSQDHIELFFCSLRQRGGFDVNPHALKFMNSYKRLLVHNEVSSAQGNVLDLESVSILTTSSVGRRGRKASLMGCFIDGQDVTFMRNTTD